ncbi:MAG TPA: hypothetical protein VEU51_03740 [Candidatus Acidoferrales bacterium]|nr:hypothetical protein [Candidatus Acidoferrales bacterium]
MKTSRTFGLAAGALAICFAGCSSAKSAPPPTGLAAMQMTPAAAGACEINAVKMCTEVSPPTAPSEKVPLATSYPMSNMPDSVEFQIPAGQAVKLMCYYDPQHKSVLRGDATPESPLTEISVQYLKKQHFCMN